MGVGRLTGGGNVEAYYTVLHIMICGIMCIIVLSVCTYIASCLWSMMFVQHSSFILCSFAVHRTDTVRVCITANLGCPFNSNVGGGTSHLPHPLWKVTPSGLATSPCHSFVEVFASLKFTLSSLGTLRFQTSCIGTYKNILQRIGSICNDTVKVVI